jgi:signal transduction histidine kinase
MSFFQQLIQYLSQPPDSIVYHIVTLLALQATLGLAWWQTRRSPDDAFARRLAWAAGIILLLRLLVLLALFATTGLVEAVTLLPPLERAVDALSVALVVWALAPQPRNLPHLGSALLLITVVVIIFFYASFALAWQDLVENGVALEGYSGTQQAAVWDILQMILLGIGAALVLVARESQWTLRLAILATLFAAHGLSLWFGGSLGAPNVDISFWARLGNVIAYPMMAVLAYRHNLRNLLPASHMGRPVFEQMVHSLNLSRVVTESLEVDQTSADALAMVSSLVSARFIAIALVNEDRPQHLHLLAQMVDEENIEARSAETRSWALKRDDWPSFVLALSQHQQVELLPDGPGARQLHELGRELNLSTLGPMLVEPLVCDSVEIGLLLLSGEKHSSPWPDGMKTLCRALGPYLAQSLYNARRYQMAMAGRAPEFERDKALLVAELSTTSEERDQALNQVAELREQLSATRGKLDADHQRLLETTQALAIAVQRQVKVQRLEAEVDALRESLSEAELALASAAAGEVGLSAEWVMRTVTRYSGELEEAQAQLNAMELQLEQQDSYDSLEDIGRKIRELRTPLTSLGGYTDLLLDKNLGAVSPQQESLLNRMQVNVAKMTKTVDSITGVAIQERLGASDQLRVDVCETIEAAINAVSPELQAKALRVDLHIEDDLPTMLEVGDSFYQLVCQALNGACLVSNDNGRLLVSAAPMNDGGKSGQAPHERQLLRLSVGDDAGEHSHEMYARAVGESSPPQSKRSKKSVAALFTILEDTAKLSSARGGRTWLDLTSARGSTLFLVLPISNTRPNAVE